MDTRDVIFWLDRHSKFSFSVHGDNDENSHGLLPSSGLAF